MIYHVIKIPDQKDVWSGETKTCLMILRNMGGDWHRLYNSMRPNNNKERIHGVSARSWINKFSIGKHNRFDEAMGQIFVERV